MATLTLSNLNLPTLKTKATKRRAGAPSNLNTVQTSKLYTAVKGRDLVAGATPTNSKETANAVLESIGCTLKSPSTYPKNHSLKRTQVQVPLDNKNIVDPNISTLANAKSDPNATFTSETDPFYEMDPARPVYQQAEQESLIVATMPDTSQLCADIYAVNVAAGASSKIKQLS